VKNKLYNTLLISTLTLSSPRFTEANKLENTLLSAPKIKNPTEQQEIGYLPAAITIFFGAVGIVFSYKPISTMLSQKKRKEFSEWYRSLNN